MLLRFRNWLMDYLEQISPQYRTPNMQQLLQKYLRLLEGGGGKLASVLEMGFLENLIL
jgi:hypothetical protein